MHGWPCFSPGALQYASCPRCFDALNILLFLCSGGGRGVGEMITKIAWIKADFTLENNIKIKYIQTFSFCCWCCLLHDTPTKHQVSKRQVSQRSVSKRLKRQVYKTSGLQNVRFTKRQVYKTSGLQNVRFTKSQVFKTSGCKKHPCIFCTCSWWKSAGSVATIFAGKVMAVFYSLF